MILHQNSLMLKLACAQGLGGSPSSWPGPLKGLLKTAIMLSRQSKQQMAEVITFRSVISNQTAGHPRSYMAQSSVHSVKSNLKSTLTCQMRFKFHQPKKKIKVSNLKHPADFTFNSKANSLQALLQIARQENL